MDKRKAAAFLIGCSPEELINFRTEDDQVITLGPDGRKYRFSVEQLEKAEIAAAMTKTLAAIAREAEPPAEPVKAKPRPAARAVKPEQAAAERPPKVKTQSPSKTGKSSKSKKSLGPKK